ncbi:hypothetical protein J6590_011040 [Homalodisca vitripennis]|nr:hypothetical protein J6590_011040 [Homalodisca vitripennis]
MTVVTGSRRSYEVSWPVPVWCRFENVNKPFRRLSVWISWWLRHPPPYGHAPSTLAESAAASARDNARPRSNILSLCGEGAIFLNVVYTKSGLANLPVRYPGVGNVNVNTGPIHRTVGDASLILALLC